MNKVLNLSKQTTAFLAALLLVIGVVIPVLVPQQSQAAQLTTRSLKISSSANGTISTDAGGNAVSPGLGGNGTKAQHIVTFNMGTSGATVGSITIMYCTSPIVQTTCTTPTGLNAANITSTGFSVSDTSTGSPTAFSLDTTTADSSIAPAADGVCNGGTTVRTNCVAMKRASGFTDTGNPTYTITYGGSTSSYITNPTTSNYSFYARILVFSDTAYTTLVDYGGTAASTAQQVSITAKVQEVLNFSVGTTPTAPGANCTPYSDGGTLALGDTNGVLNSTTSYYADSYFRVNSNSLHGTQIYYSGDTLKSGTNSISSVGLTAGGTASTVGTSQFGLGLDSGGSNYSFTSLVGATSPYNYTLGDSGHNEFQYDTTSTTALASNDMLASSTGGIACDTGAVRYVGNVSTSTVAGIYTTTITYIAIGTY